MTPMFDTQAARARCEAASPGPWTPRIVLFLALKDDVEFAAHARSDLPAALEALEEAQGERDRNLETAKLAVKELVEAQEEIASLKADLAFVKHAAMGD